MSSRPAVSVCVHPHTMVARTYRFPHDNNSTVSADRIDMYTYSSMAPPVEFI